MGKVRLQLRQPAGASFAYRWAQYRARLRAGAVQCRFYIAQAAALPRPLLWRLHSENLVKDMVGLLKIWDMREKAPKALGNKFDIRGFNEAVLNSAPLRLMYPKSKEAFGLLHEVKIFQFIQDLQEPFLRVAKDVLKAYSTTEYTERGASL